MKQSSNTAIRRALPAGKVFLADAWFVVFLEKQANFGDLWVRNHTFDRNRDNCVATCDSAGAGVHSNFTLGAILAKVRLSPSVKDAQS